MLRSRSRNRKPGFNKFKPDIFLTDGHLLTGYSLNAKDYSSTRTHKGSFGTRTDEGDLFAGDTLVNSREPDIATFIDDFQ